MNPDKLKEEIAAILPKNSEGAEKQPLHVLDNQVAEGEQQHVRLKTDTTSQKPIRTYESDVADALARKKSTVATMVIAENKKDVAEESAASKPQSQVGKKSLLILISLIFIGAGSAGGYYLFLKSPLASDEAAPIAIKIPSVVTPDSQKVVSVGSLNQNPSAEQLVRVLANEFSNYAGGQDKILELIPVTSSGSTTIRVTGSKFIDMLGLDMPDVLKRSITDRWMLGVYASGEQKSPFILLTTDFFQNAYAGMLKWESSMPEELADMLGYRGNAREDDPTSTTSISSFFNIRGVFEDKIIRNRDIREFIGQKGQMLFLYGFIDENTIVISTSEDTIGALLNRIEKQTYMR